MRCRFQPFLRFREPLFSGNQANTGALSGCVGSAEVEEVNSRTGSASDFPGSSDTLDALPLVATAEKVNQWNKNTLVWLRAPRTLVLDELLPAALSAPSAATELLPQSAATAEVQPASGSYPARLPCVSIEPVRGPPTLRGSSAGLSLSRPCPRRLSFGSGSEGGAGENG